LPNKPQQTNYLASRRCAVDGPSSELNAKLAALDAAFGSDWLKATPPSSPVQRLWQRQDELATNELLNFGDAVERWLAEAPDWLAGQVKAVKGKDQGNAAGAIFEILGLNLFDRDRCRVVPAPASKPGFDGTLELTDGSRVLVSAKNHGLSSYEKGFLAAARRFDEAFRKAALTLRPAGVQVRVLFDALPDTSAWLAVRQEVEKMLASSGQSPQLGPAGGPWSIVLMDIDASNQPLSTSQTSTICQVFAPQHKNEQNKFAEDIRKGCSNLLRHTKAETAADVCRMIILRLTATASIQACADWADWYFREDGSDQLALILLYQTAVVDEGGGNSTLTHYLLPITGPAFETWKHANGGNRKLPSMRLLVGSVAEGPPVQQLTDGAVTLDLSHHYSYQRGDIFRAHDPTYSSGMISLGSPGPGVSVHLVLETPGMPSHTISVRGHRDQTLELLP
jgi:hypothetical protein